MLKNTMAAVALTVISALPALAQDDTWTWRKTLPAGQTIEIRGVIGDITASAAAGDVVEVVAHKTSRDGAVSEVRIEAVERAGGVTICALYDPDDECLSDEHSRSNNRHNDTKVDFEVRVPRGIVLDAQTIIGRVEASGLSADVRASSVTGNVHISTAGLAEASSVSGSITARMGRADWKDDLSFSTVSGDIRLEFPALDADVSLSTISGQLSSDWDIAVQKTGRGRVRGTVGKGGRALSLSTVSGDVELRKIP